ncbi:hypothetical protein [Paenibacillus aceti]|uniref:CoF synthetase n=1 Tax=Paenibacillus aceti TaxID=1820010 RepID=A0ABQ1VSW0_9BACL|nr:hypothetical protein [Paenibacillus aceti]GGF90634.1 hypothetical protein GCM10010913_10130 [Paenibacillus aceti]
MNNSYEVEQRLQRFVLDRLQEYPFYRPFGKVAHLHELPVVDKRMINEQREQFERPVTGKIYETFTSGTTGIPFRCIKTAEERLQLSMALYRQRKKWGLPANHQMLLLSNRSLTEGHHLGHYVSKLMKNRYHMIQGRASALLSLAQYISDQGVQVPDSLLFIQNWGEPVHAFQKKEIEQVFQVPFVDYYGLEELWAIAFSNRNGQLEVDEQSVYLEILEPGTFRAVQEGEYGEVVVTSFVMRSIPFIRYRTGDIGRIFRDPSGALLLELFPVRNEQIKLPNGQIPSSIFRYLDKFFYELAEHNRIRQFQVIQETYTDFRLLVVAEQLEEPLLHNKLEKFLSQSLSTEVRLTIERKDGILPSNNGKLQSFISLV